MTEKNQKGPQLITAKLHSFLMTALLIILTAVAVGGAIYQWQSVERTELKSKLEADAKSLVEEIKREQTRTKKLQEELSDASKINDEQLEIQIEEVKKIQRKLLEVKVKIAINDEYGVEDVYVDPASRTKFYFAVYADDKDSIKMYDNNKDLSYNRSEEISLEGALVSLYDGELKKWWEYRIAGATAGKVIFYEYYTKDEAGECDSPWTRENLEYVALNLPDSEKLDYEIPKDLLLKELDKKEKCLLAMEE